MDEDNDKINKPIGGYFELQLDFSHSTFLHDNLYCVNSGRNALELILRNITDIKSVCIPYFTCDVVLEPFKKLNIPTQFYHIDESLEIKDFIDLKNGEYLLYTNYFGIKDKYVRKLCNEYNDHIIIDNSQGFYMEPYGSSYFFYSPRKFFGLPDGGMAYIPSRKIDLGQYQIDLSCDRVSHLLKRIELNPAEGYANFKTNSKRLIDEPIKRMSRLTELLLKNIDFQKTRLKRIENYKYLHQNLGKTNAIRLTEDNACPMVYPYWKKNHGDLLKKELIKRQIFVATYWPNVLDTVSEKNLEYKLSKEIVHIPTDQRYNINDLAKILEYLNEI